ncbi:hypothetical protein [Micromonospora sp. NPDC005203]|uniref:hypothetical protein n=1 Tax=Micromonospora sp. NPDC005203 TaxID=3364226 RepID=UPI0036BD5659
MDPAEPAAVALPLVAAVARGVALVVVLPVRLLWELTAAAGRLVVWFAGVLAAMGSAVGRAARRLLWAPLVWLARHGPPPFSR